MMRPISIRTLTAAATLIAFTSVANAQQSNANAPAKWDISPSVAYGYDADGKTMIYKMGTSNAKSLLSGAKKVKKNTFFFIGENGQLYMKTEPFIEGGKFKYGPG